MHCLRAINRHSASENEVIIENYVKTGKIDPIQLARLCQRQQNVYSALRLEPNPVNRLGIWELLDQLGPYARVTQWPDEERVQLDFEE